MVNRKNNKNNNKQTNNKNNNNTNKQTKAHNIWVSVYTKMYFYHVRQQPTCEILGSNLREAVLIMHKIWCSYSLDWSWVPSKYVLL